MKDGSEEWREARTSSVGRIPKYYRLKQELREEISRLDPGAAIATERVLSARFAVSRTTVRQALQELAIEGLLQRFQGRGTFVAPAKLTQTLQLTSYTEDTAAMGRRPTSRLLDVAVIPASEDVAAELDLPTNAKVQRVERLRLADEEPMAVEAVYLDAEHFGAVGDALDRGTSLYAVLRDRYGVTLAHATETIEAVLASPAEANLLETGSGVPLLLLTRTSWDQQGRPVEYVRSLYRGDRYRFVANLAPPGAPPEGEQYGVGRRSASVF